MDVGTHPKQDQSTHTKQHHSMQHNRHAPQTKPESKGQSASLAGETVADTHTHTHTHAHANTHAHTHTPSRHTPSRHDEGKLDGREMEGAEVGRLRSVRSTKGQRIGNGTDSRQTHRHEVEQQHAQETPHLPLKISTQGGGGRGLLERRGSHGDGGAYSPHQHFLETDTQEFVKPFHPFRCAIFLLLRTATRCNTL